VAGFGAEEAGAAGADGLTAANAVAAVGAGLFVCVGSTGVSLMVSGGV
jgi:hypothetical protein